MAKTALTWIGEDRFVIAIDRANTRDIVRGRGRALGGTFASDVVDRVCDCFLTGVKDLKQEFEDYYRPEYSSFSDFLFRKHGLSIRAISTMLKDDSADRIIATGDVCAGGDYNLTQILESEVGWRLLAALLDVADVVPGTEVDEHEDQK